MNRRVSARRFRSRIAITISIAILLAGSAYVLRDQPVVRRCLLRTADVLYTQFHFLSYRPPVQFGNHSLVGQQGVAEMGPQVPTHIKSEYRITVESRPIDMYHPRASEFGHEWLTHERVLQFQKALPFDVQPAESIFELSQKVRSLVEHGRSPLPKSRTNPIQYLEFAKENRRLTCRYFSIIYGATTRVAGYTSRLLSLSKDGINRNHAVCEVYVPIYSKWVLIDSDFNVAYRRNGVWLNAAELHKAWNDVKTKVEKWTRSERDLSDIHEYVRHKTDIELVELGTAGSKLRESNLYQVSPTGMNLEFFEHVLYCIRNDYLSANYPAGHPTRTREYLLQSQQGAKLPGVSPEAFQIEDIEEFYWSVGQSRIEITSWSKEVLPSVILSFTTWTPNFEFFEFRVDDGTWKRVGTGKLKRELHIGSNVFEIRSVNSAALRGEISRLQISLNQKTSLNKNAKQALTSF